MGAHDLDTELARFAEAVQHIGANLLALDQDPTVALLDAAKLEGASAELWSNARHALNELFDGHSSLRVVVERAGALRGTSRTVPAARQREIVALLAEQSIVVSDVARDIDERGLLDRSRRVVRCTPDELIARMEQQFEQVKMVVVTAQRTWGDHAPRVRSARLTLSNLAACSVGSSNAGWLADLQRELDTIAATILADPLSFDPSGLQRINDELFAAAGELAAADDLRTSWLDRVASARTQLEHVVESIRRAEASIAEGATFFASCPRQAEPEAWDAAAELERVVQGATTGEWAAAAVALDNWWKHTDRVLDANRGIVATTATMFDSRNELRGRLAAFHAKADSLGALEDGDVAMLYERARTALYTAPTDLAVAAELVREYQDALSTRIARPGRRQR